MVKRFWPAHQQSCARAYKIVSLWPGLLVRKLHQIQHLADSLHNNYWIISYLLTKVCTVVECSLRASRRHSYVISRSIHACPAFSTPANLIPRFPVLRFPALRVGPSFSSPAFSTLAIWSLVFRSCIFQSRVFSPPSDAISSAVVMKRIVFERKANTLRRSTLQNRTAAFAGDPIECWLDIGVTRRSNALDRRECGSHGNPSMQDVNEPLTHFPTKSLNLITSNSSKWRLRRSLHTRVRAHYGLLYRYRDRKLWKSRPIASCRTIW